MSSLPSQNPIWQAFIGKIKEKIPPESYHTWFKPMKLLEISDHKMTVQLPSHFYYDWIEEHYAKIIDEALSDILGNGFKLNYSILESDTEQFLKLGPKRGPFITPRKVPANFHLNQRYSFDNFIEGDSNSFARAAALAVAQAPGKTPFNPLVVYGGVGLGKTHLVQAIGNYAFENRTLRKALYVSSEKFTLDFIISVKENKTTDFSSRYRSTDILLVDDVQFFEGKERTQREFFHTFNTLYQMGKQIVLSMDRPPSELTQIEERLLSRFGWGLVTDIQPPDYETRIAILQRRSDDENISLDNGVLEYLAANITNNIRELEGCLIRLMAHASITGEEVTPELAKRLLRDTIKPKPRRTSVDRIQEITADWAGIPSDLLRGNSRKKDIARARQLAMYLTSELTNHTLKSIGSHFGNRDHTTVMHSINVTKKRIVSDSEFKSEVEELKRRINSSSV